MAKSEESSSNQITEEESGEEISWIPQNLKMEGPIAETVEELRGIGGSDSRKNLGASQNFTDRPLESDVLFIDDSFGGWIVKDDVIMRNNDQDIISGWEIRPEVLYRLINNTDKEVVFPAEYSVGLYQIDEFFDGKFSIGHHDFLRDNLEFVPVPEGDSKHGKADVAGKLDATVVTLDHAFLSIKDEYGIEVAPPIAVYNQLEYGEEDFRTNNYDIFGYEDLNQLLEAGKSVEPDDSEDEGRCNSGARIREQLYEELDEGFTQESNGILFDLSELYEMISDGSRLSEQDGEYWNTGGLTNFILMEEAVDRGYFLFRNAVSDGKLEGLFEDGADDFYGVMESMEYMGKVGIGDRDVDLSEYDSERKAVNAYLGHEFDLIIVSGDSAYLDESKGYAEDFDFTVAPPDAVLRDLWRQDP